MSPTNLYVDCDDNRQVHKSWVKWRDKINAVASFFQNENSDSVQRWKSRRQDQEILQTLLLLLLLLPPPPLLLLRLKNVPYQPGYKLIYFMRILSIYILELLKYWYIYARNPNIYRAHWVAQSNRRQVTESWARSRNSRTVAQ